MLKSHMDAIENHLISISKIPANSGHTLHKGTPREAFIKEFLSKHLSESVAIGTGEIIDAKSKPGESRNQYDIVIYKKNYPKLDFGGGISGFLIESVIATIEVKSILNQDAVTKSLKAAHNAKSLIPNINTAFTTGWIPPKVLNFVISYIGPSRMELVYSYLQKSHAELGIPFPKFDSGNRLKTPGTGIDGIVVLNKGFIISDNTPLSLNKNNPNGTYTIGNSLDGNILLLFLILQSACDNVHGAWLNPIPYISSAKYSSITV